MPQMGIGNTDPYRNFKFIVTITGPVNFANAGFAKCTGLTRTNEAIEYREGGENTTMHQLPGQTKYEPIVLERGSTQDTDLINWAAQVDDFNGAGLAGLGNFNPTRATLTITVMDFEQNPLLLYVVQRAWVAEYRAGEFDAKGNDILIESITVRHEGFTQQGTRLPSVAAAIPSF